MLRSHYSCSFVSSLCLDAWVYVRPSVRPSVRVSRKKRQQFSKSLPRFLPSWSCAHTPSGQASLILASSVSPLLFLILPTTVFNGSREYSTTIVLAKYAYVGMTQSIPRQSFRTNNSWKGFGMLESWRQILHTVRSHFGFQKSKSFWYIKNDRNTTGCRPNIRTGQNKQVWLGTVS